MKSKLNFKSNKKILILVILILLTFLLLITTLNNKLKSINENLNINSNILNEKREQNEKQKNNLDNYSQNTNSSEHTLNYNWQVTIPAISLQNAPIKEGIDETTLNEYIGHFPSTSNLDGNVGLAAHNRGYENNYFMNIDKLNIGDEIIYILDGKKIIYKVEKKIEIDSYDWSYLNQTTDNRITLITCIDNVPNKRLVIQAVE